jgi:hypothetical protein
VIRIYADFNEGTNRGVDLGIPGSVRDIERVGRELVEGERVMLYVPNDFEVEATLFREDGHWYADPDLATIRYVDA